MATIDMECPSKTGYFHLTNAGWVEGDPAALPQDRIETWLVESFRPSPHAKEHVRLTRIWSSDSVSELGHLQLHAHFGEAIAPSVERTITLQCRA